MLQKRFVIGWRNIKDQEYVGKSHGYTTEQTAVGTTNGAGPHNIQLFVLHHDGTVLHALPGFWHPKDLADELRFALRIQALWTSRSLSQHEKIRRFHQMHMEAIASLSKETIARITWQNFDAKNERKRLEEKPRDTFLKDEKGQLIRDKQDRPMVKPTIQVVHERMSRRPFIPYERFDTFDYVDYGRIYYDNNKKVDGAGSTLESARTVADKKAKAAKRAEKKAKRLKEKKEARKK
jgi:hypothetical protein